jgi:hypothetical protein
LFRLFFNAASTAKRNFSSESPMCARIVLPFFDQSLLSKSAFAPLETPSRLSIRFWINVTLSFIDFIKLRFSSSRSFNLLNSNSRFSFSLCFFK